MSRMPQEYHTNYTREYRIERRKMCYDLLGNRCARCNNQFNHYEFDHLDPSTKQFNIAQILTGAKDRLLTELKKCQLLCYDCHKEKTKEIIGRPEHGITAYRHHGCRCEICRKAVNDASIRQRSANPRDYSKKQEKFFGSFL